MSEALIIRQLNKTYTGATHPALSQINLTVKAGEILALLGPNGAGKTTLISCVCGLLSPSSGEIIIFEKNLNNYSSFIKRQLGVVPQDFAFYTELTPWENLNYFGAMYGLTKNEVDERTRSLLHQLGLLPVADNIVQTFSGGMKRRLNIAIGTLHQPKLLLLDEPTVGVDVQSKAAIIMYLKELQQSGTTILYTSHLMDEAENFCSDFAIIDHGKMIAQGNLNQLKQNAGGAKTLEEVFLFHTGHALRD